MAEIEPAASERPLRVDLPEGAIRGVVRVSPLMRTLDDLNIASKRFLTLHAPHGLTGEWRLGVGEIAINKSTIVMVRELTEAEARSGARFGTFWRAPVLLHLPGFEIRGFIHVPPGGDPIRRVEQDKHTFVPLTSTLVSGADGEATAAFVAVNRTLIRMAQVLEKAEAEPAVERVHAAGRY
jgi:hypothetical protein